MTELLPMIQTTLGGANLAILMLVLYRVTELERDVKSLQEAHNKTALDVAVLMAGKVNL